MKISGHFTNIYPLKMPNFYPVSHAPLSSCLPFEHYSPKMGSLDIEPLYSPLCPRISLYVKGQACMYVCLSVSLSVCVSVDFRHLRLM